MLGYPGAIPGRPPVYAYLRVLRQRMWLIVIVALAASLTASAFSYLSKPVYRASMKLVVGTGGKQFQPGLGEFAEPFNQTISSLIESDIVARTVIENRGLPIAPQRLLNGLEVTSRPESSVLDVEYDATTPAMAVTVLDELAKAFPPLVQARLGEGIARTGAQDDVSVPIAVRVFEKASPADRAAAAIRLRRSRFCKSFASWGKTTRISRAATTA